MKKVNNTIPLQKPKPAEPGTSSGYVPGQDVWFAAGFVFLMLLALLLWSITR